MRNVISGDGVNDGDILVVIRHRRKIGERGVV